MEGATMGIKYGLDLLKSLGVDSREIRLTGGGAKSPIWRQMTADLLNSPVICPSSDEAGALGAALQSCWCWYRHRGEQATIESITGQYVKMNPKTRCEPDPNTVSVYEALYQEYLELNEAVSPVFK
jgi:xylulokinase